MWTAGRIFGSCVFVKDGDNQYSLNYFRSILNAFFFNFYLLYIGTVYFD